MNDHVNNNNVDNNAANNVITNDGIVIDDNIVINNNVVTNDNVVTDNNITTNNAVEITDLKVHFPIHGGVFGKVSGHVKAVDGVTFHVKRGEVFALVGESGCGKTTTAQSVMGLVPPTAGEIKLSIGDHKNYPTSWNNLRGASERKKMRRQIQFIFQDPFSSLNPRMTVRATLEEPLVIHNLGTKSERDARIFELLDQVGLARSYLDRYPHEFSGGQRQRIGIARALATSPEFIIADEPVSALDVSIQAQIINLLQDLKRQYEQTMLFISHDLAVVRHIADRIAVMYKGEIVESGESEEVFASPKHEYTKQLLDSVPKAVSR